MRKNVLNLDFKKANVFFLDPKMYSTIELPKYFSFKKILKKISSQLPIHSTADKRELEKAKQSDEVNHFIYDNKDGRYAWRKIQLLNPYLYVSLVNIVTEASSWKLIQNRFQELSCSPSIRCMSIPVLADIRHSQVTSQINEWVEKVEKESIQLALDFEYLFQTDITNCFGSIYTHSVAWALHDRSVAKIKRGYDQLLGNKIDSHLQAMANGQTNGVPQGSVLMNFIAEIVLAYADSLLFNKISLNNDITESDYRILRYRDDYRIFVKNPIHGEMIMKCLSDTLADIGMTLNTGKTRRSEEIIRDSIKPDKFNTLEHIPLNELSYTTVRNELLLIYKLGIEYSNGGTIVKRLTILNDKVDSKLLQIYSNEFVSILINIAFDNPKSFPVVAALISRSIDKLSKKSKKVVINKLLRKINLLPNSGILKIWLQRITIKHNFGYDYNETLCKIADGKDLKLFNTEWINSSIIQREIDNANYVNKTTIRNLDTVINKKEIELFAQTLY